jgi:hypothetical protein
MWFYERMEFNRMLRLSRKAKRWPCLPRVLGDRRPAFVRIEPLPEPFQPVKIGVHADMRDWPRIRSLIDYLVHELKARAAELNPSQPHRR